MQWLHFQNQLVTNKKMHRHSFFFTIGDEKSYLLQIILFVSLSVLVIQIMSHAPLSARVIKFEKK